MAIKGLMALIGNAKFILEYDNIEMKYVSVIAENDDLRSLLINLLSPMKQQMKINSGEKYKYNFAELSKPVITVVSKMEHDVEKMAMIGLEWRICFEGES